MPQTQTPLYPGQVEAKARVLALMHREGRHVFAMRVPGYPHSPIRSMADLTEAEFQTLVETDNLPVRAFTGGFDPSWNVIPGFQLKPYSE
jgi:hypothetical protein